MKTIPLTLMGLLILLSASTVAQERYSLIRTYVPDQTALGRIWSAGIDYEGATGKPGDWMEFVAGSAETANLSRMGIAYEIVIGDLAKHYQKSLHPGPLNALGFGYGSMGGFYTFNEVVQQLDSMLTLYPGLITSKQAIGTSVEGRTLWSVKISDNPTLNEPEEPEVLYTSLHHAREPEGMMSVIYFMWWLLEQYGVDARATYLVDHRQMWFIPVVNPDGYEYNRGLYPSGGGMWRKNRRNNGGSFGVDLNRNYGPMYMWNSPNGGSSTNPGDETYRGTAPFSEPEIFAIDGFMRSHNIRCALNYHTYGNYLVFPYGYLSAENSDSVIYRDWAYFMTVDNHYTSGTDQQTVNYSTRGNSDDYMFGDTTKPRTFAMTPEVGTTGFWPSSSEIFPLAVQNLPQNIFHAYVAGYYPVVTGSSVTDQGGNGYLDRDETFSLDVAVANKGLEDAIPLTAQLSCDNADITILTPSVTLDSLPRRSSRVISFNGRVRSDATTGVQVNFSIEFSGNEGIQRTDTVHRYLGTPTVIFSDDASSGMGNWSISGGTWAPSLPAHTLPYSFTESPSSSYPPNASSSITTMNQYSLAGYNAIDFRYWIQWAIEPTWDFALVEISTDNGSTWTSLRGELSHSGSGRSTSQALGTWGYDGYTPGMIWTEQSVNLSNHISKLYKVKVRFRVSSDGSDQRSGISVDDIRILGYVRESVQASRPQLLSPANGMPDAHIPVSFRWNKASQATSYDIEVSSDTGFTTIVFADSLIGDTSVIAASMERDRSYFWRVRSRNSYGTSDWSAPTWAFATGSASAAYPVQDRWNLVSLPLEMTEALPAVIYPTAVSPAYAVNELMGYQAAETLAMGKGYWLKFDGSQEVLFQGYHRVSDTIAIQEGWNLIGSISDVVSASAIVQVPEGIMPGPMYGYSGGYHPATILHPAKGYWARATAPGVLILSAAQQGSTATPATHTHGFNEFVISDAAGMRATLFFTSGLVEGRDLGASELPPPPPNDAFDVRFADHRNLASFGSAYGLADRRHDILLQSPQHPYTIQWIMKEDAPARYCLIAVLHGTDVVLSDITSIGSVRVEQTGVNHLALLKLTDEELLPTAFELKQNFPNPFNPVTVIGFSLPKDAVVTLAVRNILGQDIASPVQSRFYPAGNHSIEFDGSGLTSGVYFYSITATETSTQKTDAIIKRMMLLR